MTDYNGEQNNIPGTAQPTDVQPEISAEPHAAVAPDESYVPVSEASAEQTVAETQGQQAAESSPSTVNTEPAEVQQTVPVYQMPAVYPATPESPKKSKAPIFMGIGIFVAGVIIALAIVFAMGGNKDGKGGEDTAEATTQISTTEESGNDTDTAENNDDTASEEDTTDKDDGVIILPKGRGYEEYLCAFGDLFLSDFTNFEKIFPDSLWENFRYTCEEDFGYLPSKDEVVEYMVEDVILLEPGDAIVGDYILSVYEERPVDNRTVRKLQEGLAKYMIYDDIEEACEITFYYNFEYEGESGLLGDTAYAVCIDGEWTLMSLRYDIYFFDCTMFEDIGTVLEGTI